MLWYKYQLLCNKTNVEPRRVPATNTAKPCVGLTRSLSLSFRYDLQSNHTHRFRSYSKFKLVFSFESLERSYAANLHLIFNRHEHNIERYRER